MSFLTIFKKLALYFNISLQNKTKNKQTQKNIIHKKKTNTMEQTIFYLGLFLIVALIILLALAYKSKNSLEKTLTDELKGLSTQIEENQKEIARKNSSILSVATQRDNLLTEVSSLEAEKYNYFSQLNELNKSIGKLKKENETCISVNTKLSLELKEKTEVVEITDRLIGELRMENEVIKGEIEMKAYQIEELSKELESVKAKLARPKNGKKAKEVVAVADIVPEPCLDCADCNCQEEECTTTTTPIPTFSEVADETEQAKPNNSKEVIEEFYKFLKSKGKKLPKKFNTLCDTLRGDVNEYLKNTHIENFVSSAFDWDKDDSTKWVDISIDWMTYCTENKLV